MRETKTFHQITKEIEALVREAEDGYTNYIIQIFAHHIFGKDWEYHMSCGKAATIDYIRQNFEKMFELRRNAAIDGLLRILQMKESNWSGGYSVSNMMEQIQRQVILKYIGPNFDTPVLVKNKMLQMVEEWGG